MPHILNDYKHYKIKAFYIKPTLACDHCCDYCYVSSDIKGSTLRSEIKLSTIENLITSYRHLSKTHPECYEQNIHFIWHGGEPLLMGLDFYKKVIDLQRKHIGPELNIINMIQTAGALINSEWAEFFKKTGWNIGVSIDGPKFIHDLHRRFKRSGKSSFNRVINGIEILQKYKIPFGTLAVITKESVKYPEKILNFFLEHNISSTDFLPCIHPPSAPEPQALADFWIKIFKEWYPKRNKLNIYFLDDTLKLIEVFYSRKKKSRQQKRIQRQFLSDPPFLCELTGICGRLPSVLPNGDVYPCECLMKDCFKLGNIDRTGIGEILGSSSFNNLKKLHNQVDEKCFSCRFFNICRCGCLRRRMLYKNQKDRRDIYCSTRQRVFSHILSSL